jgi:chymotrypsin-like protease
MRRVLLTSLVLAALLAVPAVQSETADARPSVVNGSLAHRGQAPWIVGLSIDPGTRQRTWCGGTLITHYLVLTAAHCIKGSHRWYITAGTRTFHGFHQKLTHAHRARWAIYDGQYGTAPGNPYYAGDDFALVASKSYIRAQPIRVNNSYSLPYGHYFNVFGWGATDAESTTYATHLRRGVVQLYPDSACGNQSVGAQLCVGEVSTATQSCHGDSGGPLTWGVGPQAVQVGVVSYGVDGKCGAGRSIYGDVANSAWLRGWLHHYGVPGW